MIKTHVQDHAVAFLFFGAGMSLVITVLWGFLAFIFSIPYDGALLRFLCVVWGINGVVILGSFLIHVIETLLVQRHIQRLSSVAPMLQTTLHTLQSALQDPSLSFQQLSELVQNQISTVSAHLKDHPDTFAITPLIYLQEDMRRGLSPRKTLVDYLRAQHGVLRAGFDQNPRLHEDLADELHRLKRRVSVFAG